MCLGQLFDRLCSWALRDDLDKPTRRERNRVAPRAKPTTPDERLLAAVIEFGVDRDKLANLLEHAITGNPDTTVWEDQASAVLTSEWFAEQLTAAADEATAAAAVVRVRPSTLLGVIRQAGIDAKNAGMDEPTTQEWISISILASDQIPIGVGHAPIERAEAVGS